MKIIASFSLIAVFAASACSDDEVPLRVQPFAQNGIELQVNQQHFHKIRLNKKVTEKTFVDLDFASHSSFLQIPEFVTFKIGEEVQDIEVVGKAATPNAAGQYMKLTFTLRGTDSTQDWSYRVVGGPSGPAPDGSTPPPPPPDSGTPADTGAPDADPSDAGVPEAAPPAVDAAPDTGADA